MWVDLLKHLAGAKEENEKDSQMLSGEFAERGERRAWAHQVKADNASVRSDLQVARGRGNWRALQPCGYARDCCALYQDYERDRAHR